ncbi:hypothetical protein [Micromonospora sp. WMMD1274]|uniref:hypothetical protein n=1 Tax=Micromonospora sp. WMMD1274 TaxID=3404116 RepID=UPI003B9393BE
MTSNQPVTGPPIRDSGTSTSPLLGPDFGRLWGAHSLSELGSAVGAGALPLIAILLLDASSLQVPLLAVVSGLAAAVIILPLGPFIEIRRMRPVMVGADLLGYAATNARTALTAAAALTIASAAFLPWTATEASPPATTSHFFAPAPPTTAAPSDRITEPSATGDFTPLVKTDNTRR